MNPDPFRLPRWKLTQVVVLAVCQATTLVFYLLLMRAIIDAHSVGIDEPNTIYRLIGLLAAALLINAGLRGVEFAVAEKMGYEVVSRVRLAMYDHMQGMSPRQIEGRSRGGLVLRFTGDLSMLRTWISRGIARGIVSMIVLSGGLIAVSILSIRLALTIGFVLATGAAITNEFGPRLRRITRLMRRKRSLLTSNIDEQIHALPVVQINGRSGGERSRFAQQNDDMTQSLFDTASIRGAMLGVSTATAWVALLAVLTVGTMDIVSGRSTVGSVVAAVVATRQLTGPVRRLGLAYDYRQRAEVSKRKVFDFLKTSSRDLQDPTKERLTVRDGSIELINITVEGALENISASIVGGRVIAVMGPTGAGKSTLLGTVAGLVEPDDGELLIDGRDVARHTLSSRFRMIGMVGPDLPLMRGSVRRNLTYRKPTVSDDELRRVVMSCHLDEVFAGLPRGIDTWVIEGGRNLSVGQRQRIALGRALLGNPPLLLLDEPTANLDEPSREIFRRLIAHHQGTVLLATHDPVEAALADEVWLLEGGRIVEIIPGMVFRDRRWATAKAAPRA